MAETQPMDRNHSRPFQGVALDAAMHRQPDFLVLVCGQFMFAPRIVSTKERMDARQKGTETDKKRHCTDRSAGTEADTTAASENKVGGRRRSEIGNSWAVWPDMLKFLQRIHRSTQIISLRRKEERPNGNVNSCSSRKDRPCAAEKSYRGQNTSNEVRREKARPDQERHMEFVVIRSKKLHTTSRGAGRDTERRKRGKNRYRYGYLDGAYSTSQWGDQKTSEGDGW
ncbi:hypothetical protein B0H12DRAFT_1067608 [Mycena haematopus]|nr:hypothetical protein B0H12DRAFT_1067608 [Mycena haematopus]